MIIRVTNAIRNGEIVLPTVGYAVKAGVALTISDEHFYNNDIQIGIRKGWLVVENSQGHDKSPFAKKILIRNLSGRPLALDKISLLIGEESYVSEKEVQSTNFQTAVNSGMVEVEYPEDDDDEDDEDDRQPLRTVKKGKKKAVKEKKKAVAKKPAEKSKKKTLDPLPQPRKETTAQKVARLARESARIDIDADDDSDDHLIDEYDPDALTDELQEALEREQHEEAIRAAKQAASKTKMGVWNPHTKQMMGKEESARKIGKVVNSRVDPKSLKKRTASSQINADGVMSGEVDFTDEGMRRAKKVTTSLARKDTKKTRSGLTPVGQKRPEASFIDAEMDMELEPSELRFVDREQNRDRLRQRPDLLARRQARQNGEIE